MASTSTCRKCSTTSTIKQTVSTAKSTVTAFTPDTHESYSKVGRQSTTANKKPELLGVAIDTRPSFTHHCNNIAVKVRQHINVLKALTDSSLGCDE